MKFEGTQERSINRGDIVFVGAELTERSGALFTTAKVDYRPDLRGLDWSSLQSRLTNFHSLTSTHRQICQIASC
jgi:hypothetical protein